MSGWARLALVLVLGHVLAPLLPLVIAAEALALAVTVGAVAVLAARGWAWRPVPAGAEGGRRDH